MRAHPRQAVPAPALTSKGKKVQGIGGDTEFQQAQSSQSALQSGEAAFAVKHTPGQPFQEKIRFEKRR